MKLPHKVSQWLNSIPTVKFLFLLAVFLLLYAVAAQSFLSFKQKDYQDVQASQLIDFIIKSGDQQLKPLLVANRYEAIPEVLTSLLTYQQLQSLAVYQANGNLIDKAVAKSSKEDQNFLPKVSYLSIKEQDTAYIIYQFNAPNSQVSSNHHWLYYLSGVVWLLAAITLLFKIKPNKATKPVIAELEPRVSYRSELKQLLKRSQQQLESSNLLIIHANWELYNQKPKQTLLSLFNKWTAHNKSSLVSFENDLLIFALPEELGLDNFKKIQILESCLKQLDFNPKLLINNLKFENAVYQHFFSIVEPGLWIEATEDYLQTLSDIIKTDIEIEVEDFGEFHLLMIDALTADDAMVIERQTRFLLQ
ncbi:hypothetical protein [Kangiella sp. HZ709]|uniref:hypothetical protein n=1 Tax=Kangiella sp. HZ709 TaxID=2666328 RepID=UPI0012AFF465|nr:hypothetical protein [Kangiella sp. HZ709]MRX28534.1 hypothetical protein [Kangiella sp. HZ709]